MRRLQHGQRMPAWLIKLACASGPIQKLHIRSIRYVYVEFFEAHVPTLIGKTPFSSTSI